MNCIAKSRFFLAFLVVLFCVCSPLAARAQVVVSEIMYDVSGSDDGHEWIEVVNEGNSGVDIATYKFFEGGKYHELNLVKGSALLSAGTRVIIANDANKFSADYPSFAGTLFDSSFSLSNTTETVGIATGDKVAVDMVTYASSQGGAGDGNSLQKVGGAWRGASPSPGAVGDGVTKTASTVSQTQNTNDPPASSTTPSSGGSPISNLHIIADAGQSNRVVLAGAPTLFEGRAFGLKKEPLEQGRFVWSFGDGSVVEGCAVEHLYYYPGEYTAVLDVASGEYSAVDRVRVSVVKPDIVLEVGGDATRSFVGVCNNSTSEIDLSGWQLSSGGKNFVLPRNTLVGGQKTSMFPSEITGLVTPMGSVVTLHYPNGTAFVGVQPSTPTPSHETAVGPPSRAVTLAETSDSAPARKRTAEGSSPIVSSGNAQVAAVSELVQSGPYALVAPREASLWPWYAGVLLLVTLALLGARLAQRKNGGFF